MAVRLLGRSKSIGTIAVVLAVVLASCLALWALGDPDARLPIAVGLAVAVAVFWVCLRVACLLPLPNAAGGRGPASWNAFAGPWGRRRCWQTYYCDSATPPPAPGQQERYRDPARYDGNADVLDPDGGYEEGGH